MTLSETLPTLQQLKQFRKFGRFDPRAKVDVMKSRIVGVAMGEKVIGFGEARLATPAEIARLTKKPVSKSAELSPAELNAVFDDSPLLPVWSPSVQPLGALEVVSKSAELPDDTEFTPEPLEGIFPKWLQHN